MGSWYQVFAVGYVYINLFIDKPIWQWKLFWLYCITWLDTIKHSLVWRCTLFTVDMLWFTHTNVKYLYVYTCPLMPWEMNNEPGLTVKRILFHNKIRKTMQFHTIYTPYTFLFCICGNMIGDLSKIIHPYYNNDTSDDDKKSHEVLFRINVNLGCEITGWLTSRTARMTQ